MIKILTYLISTYQKRISPYKGFKCAHRGLHGDDSCSEFTKKQLLKHGFFHSIKPIKKRFRECRTAADIIKQRPPLKQRGDCDFGLCSCLDIGSCAGDASSPSLDCCSNACNLLDLISGLSKREFKRLIITLLIIFLVALIVTYFFYGRQIKSVDIRLKPEQIETTDGVVAKLFGSQQPDYRIIFEIKDQVSATNTLKNKSAKDWVTLRTNQSFYLSDINTMTIVDKELTKSKPLESFFKPSKQGEGELFEYSIKHKWDLF